MTAAARFWPIACLAVLASAATCSAQAYDQSGAAPSRPVSNVPPAEADRAMRFMADCLVEDRGRRPAITRFLRTAPRERISDEQWRSLNFAGCMPPSFLRTQMRFRPILLRGALYEALFRRERAALPSPPASGAAIDYAAELDAPGPADEVFVFLRTTGDCVVRADMARARALVLSRIGETAEADALSAVTPALAGCMTNGRSLHFTVAMIRGMLAESLYKFAHEAGAARGAG